MKQRNIFDTKDYRYIHDDPDESNGFCLEIKHQVFSDVFNVVESLCVGSKRYLLNGYQMLIIGDKIPTGSVIK